MEKWSALQLWIDCRPSGMAQSEMQAFMEALTFATKTAAIRGRTYTLSWLLEHAVDVNTDQGIFLESAVRGGRAGCAEIILRSPSFDPSKSRLDDQFCQFVVTAVKNTAMLRTFLNDGNIELSETRCPILPALIRQEAHEGLAEFVARGLNPFDLQEEDIGRPSQDFVVKFVDLLHAAAPTFIHPQIMEHARATASNSDYTYLSEMWTYVTQNELWWKVWLLMDVDSQNRSPRQGLMLQRARQYAAVVKRPFLVQLFSVYTEQPFLQVRLQNENIVGVSGPFQVVTRAQQEDNDISQLMTSKMNL
jgi:hypothetical protein